MSTAVHVSVLGETDVAVKLVKGMSVGSFLCSVYEQCLIMSPNTAMCVVLLVSPELGMLYHNKMDDWQFGTESITLAYPNSVALLHKHVMHLNAYLRSSYEHVTVKNTLLTVENALLPASANTSVESTLLLVKDYCTDVKTRVLRTRSMI